MFGLDETRIRNDTNTDPHFSSNKRSGNIGEKVELSVEEYNALKGG